MQLKDQLETPTLEVGDTQSFGIPGKKGIVVFSYNFMPGGGFVGEPVEFYKAILVVDDQVQELSYSDLQSIYRLIEGRQLRIDFWRWMKEFSPQGIEERNQRHLETVENLIK